MLKTMTRIRYYKKMDNTLMSKNEMLLGTQTVQVIINPNTLTSTIVDTISMETVFTIHANTLASLKTLTKRKLREAGVKFGDEIRNRGNTELLNLDNLPE